MGILSAILFMLANAVADSLRGHKSLFVYVHGLVTAMMLIAPVWMAYPTKSVLLIIATMVLLFVVGESTGWGTPLGAALTGRKQSSFPKYERWQFGVLLKNNPWLALAFRGFLWGVPMLLLLPYVPNVWFVPVAYAIGMPLSVFVANKVFPKAGVDYRWSVSEFIRGLITALVIITLTVIGLQFK